MDDGWMSDARKFNLRLGHVFFMISFFSTGTRTTTRSDRDGAVFTPVREESSLRTEWKRRLSRPPSG